MSRETKMGQGSTMRVTLGELVGLISAKEGADLERDLRIKAWEAEHAEEIRASRIRYTEAIARLKREAR